ncbi:uncharacterized transposon-derived, partial [Paramuricea clavata]
MANNFDMNDMTVEQLMALSEIIDDSDYEGNLEDEVEKISEDKFYRVAPKDKGENVHAEEKLFIDEGDRATDPKRPRRLPLNYKGKRGIMPTWKYSERQKAKALLVEEAYQSLLSRGVEGLPPTMGGRWRTDDPQVNAEMKRLENLRNPKRPRGRPLKVKVDGEVTPKRRGRPLKTAVAETKEVKVAKRRGRPPKAKVVETQEVTVPKRRSRPPKARVVETPKPKVRRQTVAERFISQGRIKLSVPTDSVITQVGPNKFTVTVDLSRKPTRKAPEVPKGVTPWKPRERPVPKPRTVLPKEKPVPKPRTKIPKERPVPKPRTKKPVPPPKLRKPVRVTREVAEQPVVVTPEEHEIDPFGTYLNKPSYRKIETAANGAAVTYSITPNYTDPLDQMTASRQVVRGILVNELKRMGGLKYTETIKVRMSKEIGNDKTKKDSIYFKSKTGTATNFEDIESTAAQNQLTILSRIETFQNLGSNWIILNIESHYVNIAMYKPLKGSSYMKLPADISNPKCGLINMKNEDNKCFIWSHVRHVRPKVRRATTITRQDVEFSENLDYEGIDFPVKISDIDKIERRNCISISVFGYKGKKQFYPIRNSKTKYDEHMELLLLGDGDGNNHYVLIKDVNRMLFSEIGKFKMNINVVPNNMEKYISFSLGKSLVFIDSIQFMASSLEALVSNLSPEDFRIVGKRWTGEDFKLVTQKGIFPYEYLDDISKLNVEGLPSRDKFYSSLYESEVKEEDYQRALKVWDHFKMKTMRDYHDLYLETDVLLLADVFENFRRTCLENYKLDPAHYISAPSLSWDAFLKQSGEEIEL